MFQDGTAQIVVRDYVCAQCYSDLKAGLASDGSRLLKVECPTHGDVEIVGRITRAWAEAEGQRRAARRLEIEYEFRPAPRDPAIVLQELGF